MVGSAAVGPDAITSSGSPITSERRSATIGAGWAARASWPPLSRERCFRTAFNWLIVAPHSRRRRVTACFSASVIPGTGAGVSADPPPEMRQRTRSRDRASPAIRRISAEAASPRASGIGCPDSTIRTPGGPEPRRSFTATRPSRRTSGRTAPTASAIVSDAFPAPTTRMRSTRSRSNVRPPTRSRRPSRRRASRVSRPASPAAMPASRIRRAARRSSARSAMRGAGGAPAVSGPGQEAGYRPGGSRWSRWPASRSTSSVFGKQKRIFVRPSSGCA